MTTTTQGMHQNLGKRNINIKIRKQIHGKQENRTTRSIQSDRNMHFPYGHCSYQITHIRLNKNMHFPYGTV
jgi:hypothetical protein